MDTVVDVFIALCAVGTLGLSAAFAFTLITLIRKAKGAEMGGVSGESENPSVSSADLVEDDGEELVWDWDVDIDENHVSIDYELDPGEFDFDPVFDPWLA